MHKCLGCKKIYSDDAEELSIGCSCGSKYFMYYRSSSEKSRQEIEKIEKDILDIIRSQSNIDTSKIVIFDIESVVVPKHGKYILDLEKIFKEKAIVFKVDEGKYIIDLSKLST